MMQRFAIVFLISLSVVQRGHASANAESGLRSHVVVATRPNDEYTAIQQRRQLASFSWWWSLLNHLGIHPPHPPHPPGNGRNGGSSSSHSSSSSSSSSYYNNGSSSSSNGDDSNGSSSNGNGDSGSSNSSNGNSVNSDGDAAASSSYNDDGSSYYDDAIVVDDQYSDDENLYFPHEDDWTPSSNSYLENGKPTSGGAATVGLNAKNVAPFVVGALVATLVGVAFMIMKRRGQRQDDTSQPDSSRKHKRFFNKKQLNTIDDNDESSVATGFIEISNIRNDDMSCNMSVRSYNVP